jgi:hypothetical protein
VTASLRAQQRERGLDDRQCAQHVRLEVCTSIVQARFFDGAHEAVPGIAHDHVDAAEMLMCLIDSLENRTPGRAQGTSVEQIKEASPARPGRRILRLVSEAGEPRFLRPIDAGVFSGMLEEPANCSGGAKRSNDP